MTIRGQESFDLTSAALITAGASRWNYFGVTSLMTIVGGRTGNCCRHTTNGANNSSMTRIFDSQPEWYCGFAFRKTNFTALERIFQFFDGASLQCEVYINTANQIELRRNGTLLATSTFTLLSGVWYYFEVHAVINSVTGVLTVRVDQDVKVTFSGNTRSTANNSADRFMIGHNNNVNTGDLLDYDDMYFADGNGGQTYLGDIAVPVKLPTGAGATTQWTPLSSTNVSNVDEGVPNDDTDYVSDSTVGHVDTYAFADLAANVGAVLAVCLVLRARKDDAGVRQIAGVARPASTDRVNAGTLTMSSSYQHFDQLWILSPESGVAWTRAEFNGTEFGQKVIA